jgi:drug/metabolite transporter (DMT)-like permease
VALLETTGVQDSAGSVVGDLLIFGAVVSEALYTIYAKKLAGKVEPLHATMWANIIALVLYLPLVLLTVRDFDLATMTLPLWALLVAYALMASVLSFWLWYRGTAIVPASKAGLFTALMPLTAVGLAIAALGEQPTIAHACGAVLLLGSLALAVRR